jgi:hypothetical protein
VGGGPTPAQIVVVHAGQVVVHQRVGVHDLDRAGDADHRGRAAPHRPVRRHEQRGAHPLARRGEGVGQRLAVALRHLAAEPPGPLGQDAVGPFPRLGQEVHGRWSREISH